jgi:hypothetical protein
VDLVFAPIVYRILFAHQKVTKDYCLELVEAAVASPLLTRPLTDQTSIGEYALFENEHQ